MRFRALREVGNRPTDCDAPFWVGCGAFLEPGTADEAAGTDANVKELRRMKLGGTVVAWPLAARAQQQVPAVAYNPSLVTTTDLMEGFMRQYLVL
jgi:hypothetical protein